MQNEFRELAELAANEEGGGVERPRGDARVKFQSPQPLLL